MRHEVTGYVILAAGLFSIFGGLMDWDFFMNNARARVIIDVIGREGARAFYCVIGVMLGAIGCALVLGYLK